MCGLEVSALDQCGNSELSFSELRLYVIFTFPEGIEDLTCNEQFVLVLSGQKRHCCNTIVEDFMF